MTTTGPDDGQQGLRPSLDDPNETSGAAPGGAFDLDRGFTLTSGGDGDDVDDDGDDVDYDDDDDDDIYDDEEDDDDDGGDGASEQNPA